MGPKTWTTKLGTLTRLHYGQDPLKLVTARDIISAYENGDSPEQFLKRIQTFEVSKRVPILPGGPKLKLKKPPPVPPLSKAKFHYELTSPALPEPIGLYVNSQEVLEMSRSISADGRLGNYQIREVN